MSTNDKKQQDQNDQQEVENNSLEGLTTKSPEEQAHFQQGGQQRGNSQGGQGGNQVDNHEGKNPRHDEDTELSEFAREDS
jgi:hypothetical protein